MYAIVGLGNPGRRYENTRHNIGFVTVDLLAERHGVSIRKLRHKALVGEARFGTEKVLLVKPQTYMNLSGESIGSLIRYFDLPLENLVVVYDDIDIPLGTIRIRKSGSSGTHNGMKSVIYHTEDDGFPRVRIGVGADRGEVPLVDFVTSGFAASELDTIRAAVIRAADAIEELVANGIDAAMAKYNG
ncbi:MAG: aminoacyl-tRNA hydrolase [Clostridiales Family XIII bacterium]|jgi:PTH1 family peptidyl-tRNA hydrolase|nr:aminoacyl-tRNA hydrolase [Clostridiales Family XIII bacterium]